jgi:hypothetical protein
MPHLARNYAIPGLLCASALLISACAGGGDGGSPPPQVFPVALRGKTAQAMAATYWAGSSNSSGGYTVLRDMDDFAGSTTISTSPDGTSFSLSVNEQLDSGLPVAFSQSLTLPSQGSNSSPNLFYPPGNSSLSYMSFGQWVQPMNTSALGGFFAFGSVTPGPAIPPTGTATYNGSFYAKTIEGSLLGISTINIEGNLTATADFTARQVSVSTTNAVDPRFNVGGVLNYASGTNSLRGGFSTPSSGYSGQAVARFFGPNAEELGGAFRLTRPNLICIFRCVWVQDSYVGSFGARQ